MKSFSKQNSVMSTCRHSETRAGSILRIIIWGMAPLLLVPVSILLILPAVQMARESARRTQSMATLKRIGQAMDSYHQAYSMLPPSAIVFIPEPVKPQPIPVTDPDLPPLHAEQFASFAEYADAVSAKTPRPVTPATLSAGEKVPHHSWMAALLPFVDNAELYNRMNFDVPWNTSENSEAVKTSVTQYLNSSVIRKHPSPFNAEGRALSHYAGNSQLLQPNGNVQYAHVTDGLSNTILAGEVVSGFQPWASPENVRDPALGPGATADRFGGPHVGLTMFLMCDGSVRMVSNRIDLDTMRRIADPDDEGDTSWKAEK